MNLSIPKLPSPESLRSRVHDILERLIITGELPPGTRLVESKLAEQLDVSRNPVREALITLERDGWVESLPKQGIVVRTPTLTEAKHTFQVRSVLEAEAAAQAAQNGTAAECDEMQAIIEKGWEAIAAKDPQLIADRNRQFHRAVLAAARNEVLVQLLELLEKRVTWLFTPVAVRRGGDSWKEHEALLSCIADGQPDEAARVMREHTSNTTLAFEQFRFPSPESDADGELAGAEGVQA